MTAYQKQVCRMNVLLLLATISLAQSPAIAAPGQEQGAPPDARLTQTPNGDRGVPVFGKITAIGKGSMQVAKPDGGTVAVKITDKTEYRKDRQSAKREDFKVGDLVFVRGEENQIGRAHV